ncbi:MAG TPA: hypothetical protein VMV29_24405 [Ktedonobacterales bacterium]|nr:hypothetical protein [Ktedonobacterales bacterium]
MQMFFPFTQTPPQASSQSGSAHTGGAGASPAGAGSLTPATWGWLPLICCVEALGLLTLAVADNANRANAPWGDTLFWIGLAILFLPIAIRLLSSAPSRAERIGLVVILGMALYVVKFLAYPVMFTFFDELLHVRTAQDLLAQQRLFTFNSQLPISPFYPGLEIVTTTLSQLTGLTIFTAGIIVIGVARLLLLLGLYLFYEGVSQSARLAGIATMLYMTNPHFIFFDAQFAYESLAIGLGAFTLSLVVDRLRAAPGYRASFTVAIWLMLGGLTITHHLTSYAIVALLLAWGVIFLWQRLWTRSGVNAPIGIGPIDVAIVGVLMTIGWAFATNSLVVGYIGPYLTQTTQQLSNIFAGLSPARALFVDYAGQTEPLWQIIVAFAAIALITLGLPLGLWRIWRTQRANAAALTLGVGSLLYPISQVTRLAVDGTSIASRLPDYIFIGVGFTLAMTMRAPVVRATAQRWLRQFTHGGRATSDPRGAPRQMTGYTSLIGRVVLQVLLLVVFIGEVVIGAGPNWNRMPGPYQVIADMRSMNSESIIAAQWARTHLGPGNAFTADRDNRLTLATYGDQTIITDIGYSVDLATVFTSPTFTATDLALVRASHVRYLLVDLRLTTGLPHVGVYFEQNEPQAFAHTSPLSYAALTKFGALPGVNCIYDSGDILIYDMGVYTNAS